MLQITFFFLLALNTYCKGLYKLCTVACSMYITVNNKILLQNTVTLNLTLLVTHLLQSVAQNLKYKDKIGDLECTD